MPDQIFADPRLVAIYDAFDGARVDLDHYLEIVAALGAQTVLDVGCGTGCFALLLVERGFQVVGCDPAEASIAAAKLKPKAHLARWIVSDAKRLPPLRTDLAVMTGNVAQVFVDDQDWADNLAALHAIIVPHGHLVFEVRDPARQAWSGWTQETTYSRHDVSGVGPVEGWCELLQVEGERVTFRWTYVFRASGQTITSDSTLRFRAKASILASLDQAGFDILEVRDAPDRPGKEFVFIARRRLVPTPPSAASSNVNS